MDQFIGQIIMFAGNFAPRSWAFCNGQLLAISQNTALFSILGTTYGGDGRTTFGLPDLRGRVAIHAGNGPGLSSYRLGQKSGQETVTLTINQMPSHNHTVQSQIAVSTVGGGENNPSGQVVANHAGAFNEDPSAGSYLGGITTTESDQGGNQSHNNLMPYQVVNYIIALQGTFPSRN